MHTTRKAARDAGATTYQGNPCAKGHAGLRRVGNKACVACENEARRADTAKPERLAKERARKAKQRREFYALPGNRAAERTRYKAAVAARPESVAKREARARQREARRLAKGLALIDKLEAHMDRERAAPERAAATLARKQAYWRFKQKTRRAVQRGAPKGQRLTQAQAELLFNLQWGCCAHCGEPAEHLDHIQPISRGGAHTFWNAQWLCGPCNIAKKDCPESVWRGLRGIPEMTTWEIRVRMIKVALI